jgi:hypothetical protein
VPDGLGHMLAFGPRDGFSWDGATWTGLGAGAALPNNGVVDVVFDPDRGQDLAISVDHAVRIWRWQGGRWGELTDARHPPDGCAVSNPAYDPELGGFVVTDLIGVCNIPMLP